MNKKVVITLLMILLIGVSGIAYAYWDATFIEETSRVIEIGEGAVVELEQTVWDGECKNLVPRGAWLGENDVYEMVFGYTLTSSKLGRVTVCATNVLIGGNSLNNELVVIDIYEIVANEVPQNSLTLNIDNYSHHSYEKEFFICVSLLMPVDEAQYNEVAGEEITFTIQVCPELVTE